MNEVPMYKLSSSPPPECAHTARPAYDSLSLPPPLLLLLLPRLLLLSLFVILRLLLLLPLHPPLPALLILILLLLPRPSCSSIGILLLRVINSGLVGSLWGGYHGSRRYSVASRFQRKALGVFRQSISVDL